MSLDEIVARHGGMVFGVCRRALGNVQEAEDAAQTVFLIFLEKAPTLGRGTVIATWLYRTAVYVSSNLIRSRARRERFRPAPGSPAEETARPWEEVKPHLDAALARLPGPQQEAIVVHYLQGKTLGRTAETLGCSVKALEKRVSRGLDRLRQAFSRAGAAISSAALVALLQSEATAAAPRSLQNALRGRSIPPVRPSSPLKTLLLPIAAAILVVPFVAGTLRAARMGEARVEADRSALLPSARRAPETEVPSEPPGPEAPKPLQQLLFPATFEEFHALYQRMYECPEAIDRWAALGIELQPDELRSAVGRGSDDVIDVMIVEIFREWSAREPRLAAEWLARACEILPAADGWKVDRPEGSGEGTVTLLETVLDAWLGRDAAAVDEWLGTLRPGPAREAILADYAIVASRRPRKQFDDLAAVVDGLPPSWARRVAIARVAAEWARRDPAGAAKWVQKLPSLEPGREPPFTLQQPGIEKIHLQPFASIEDPEGPEPMQDARRIALGHIARSWAASDLEAARRWSEGLADPAERREAMGSVGAAWVKVDPRAALDYARAHPHALWRRDWLEMVATEWIGRDRAAAEWVIQMASPEDRDFVRVIVLKSWAKIHPVEAAPEVVRAMRGLSTSDADRVLQGPLWHSSHDWAARDPRAAAAWAASIKDPDIRNYAATTVAVEWIKSDPRAALEWAESLPPGRLRTQLVGRAGSALASTDLDYAVQVATGLDRQDGRVEAFWRVATAWGRKSPETALAWAQSITPLTDRDECILAVLAAWAERDAQGARAQVGSLVNEELRPRALELIQESRMQVERAALRKRILER